MIVMYTKVPAKEIRAELKKQLPLIKKWFKDHPDRKDCTIQVWYGKMVTVTLDNYKEKLAQAAKDAIKGS